MAWLLLEQGWTVRALRRREARNPFLTGVELDWREGDLRDPDSIRRAMSGCRAVFHVAADYRLWAPRPADIYETNVSGTVHVLEAALAQGVERVVYTSSVGALGLHRDGTPADESTPVQLDDMVGYYKRSKFLAERKAEDFVDRGLPLVMVHPSTPVGPGDHKPTPTGKIIVDWIVCVQDCGLIVDRLTAESQCCGGITMGIGFALFEHRILDRNTAQMVNPNMEFYLMPGPSDMPEMDITLVDQPERGIVGLGEPPTISTAAAIANAVSNAIGARIRQLPVTPETVLAAIARERAGGTQ